MMAMRALRPAEEVLDSAADRKRRVQRMVARWPEMLRMVEG